MRDKLPAPVSNAADIAKLTTGIGTAVIALFFPETAPAAALAGPVLPHIIEKRVRRGEELLAEELRKGNIECLSDEQVWQFVPMAYKFLEAAKEGEHERILRILAALLTSQLHQEIPDAPSFSRMTRRIESLSLTDLRVVVLISTSLSTRLADATERPFVSASQLQGSPENKHGLHRYVIQESLTDLTGRGLLIPDAASRSAKAEEYYYVATSLTELLERARARIMTEADNTKE
jgi:hypothetical protein